MTNHADRPRAPEVLSAPTVAASSVGALGELLKEWEAETKYPVTARTIKMNTYQQDQLLEALSEAVEFIKGCNVDLHTIDNLNTIILRQCLGATSAISKDLLKKWGVPE